MTANQIAYANYKETRRSNQAREQETYRSNRVKEVETERHNRATEDEAKRHNIFTENVSVATLGETTRHNKATEEVERSKVYETSRHNKASEAIERYKAEESARHNITAELETERHNRATESVSDRKNEIDFMNYSLKSDEFEHYTTTEFPAQQELWEAQTSKARKEGAKATKDMSSYFAQYLDDDGFMGGTSTLGWFIVNALDWAADVIPG